MMRFISKSFVLDCCSFCCRFGYLKILFSCFNFKSLWNKKKNFFSCSEGLLLVHWFGICVCWFFGLRSCLFRASFCGGLCWFLLRYCGLGSFSFDSTSIVLFWLGLVSLNTCVSRPCAWFWCRFLHGLNDNEGWCHYG